MIDRLIRSKRRTLALHVTADARLVVRAPEKLPENIIRRFVEDRKDWILRKKQQAREHYSPPVQRTAAEKLRCREKAMEIIGPRVAHYSALSGYKPSDIKITSAKTRWGSCSPSGCVNFSWHLSLAPLEVVDYVVVHELVHLEEKNHSRNFWRKVERILPDYKEAYRWLGRNGHQLMT